MKSETIILSDNQTFLYRLRLLYELFGNWIHD